MPKRLDQMTILERADIRYEMFVEREELRDRRERFWKLARYGMLITSFARAIKVLLFG
ncbi:MAG: hypothetical protein ABWZ66_11550 [Pyrinomonadaceae bacterium]